MSNIQKNLIAEFERIGFSSPVFSLAELQSRFEQNGVWIINGEKYDSGNAKSNIANFSIGPGDRIGAGVKRGLPPLFNKHPGKGVYSIYEQSAVSDHRYTSFIAQPSSVIKATQKSQKARMFSTNLGEKTTELTVSKNAHSECFAKHLLSPKSESWPSGNVRGFAEYLFGKGLDLNLLEYPNEKFNRQALFAFVYDITHTTLNCCIAICAWGGMNREHGYRAFSCWSDWEPIAKQIRTGELNRNEAYDAFSELRRNKKLKGLGPAYFTKIIYFLSKPENRGYIMDQWTARSFNLLQNNKIVALVKTIGKSKKVSYVVSDKNSAECYENFCRFIEQLAQKYQTTPDLIEMSLFSQGRSKRKWRNYVISQDSYLYS